MCPLEIEQWNVISVGKPSTWADLMSPRLDCFSLGYLGFWFSPTLPAFLSRFFPATLPSFLFFSFLWRWASPGFGDPWLGGPPASASQVLESHACIPGLGGSLDVSRLDSTSSIHIHCYYYCCCCCLEEPPYVYRPWTYCQDSWLCLSLLNTVIEVLARATMPSCTYF